MELTYAQFTYNCTIVVSFIKRRRRECNDKCTGPGELTVPLIQIPQIVFISKTSLLSLVVGFRMCQLSCQALAHEELTVLLGMKLCPIVQCGDTSYLSSFVRIPLLANRHCQLQDNKPKNFSEMHDQPQLRVLA